MGIRLISFFGGRQAAAPIFAGFASLRKLCVRTTTMLLVVLTSYLHAEIEVYYLNDIHREQRFRGCQGDFFAKVPLTWRLTLV